MGEKSKVLRKQGRDLRQAEQGQAAAALPEDPGVVPSIHKEAHSKLQLYFQVMWSSGTRHAHGTYTHMQTVMYTHEIKLSNTFSLKKKARDG